MSDVDAQAHEPMTAEQVGAAAAQTITVVSTVARELALRLADGMAMLAAATGDDAQAARVLADPAALLSAIEHALTGDPGHDDLEEWDARRVGALEAFRERLGL